MDKDFCLTGIKKTIKLAKDEIYKDFSTVVRERKKDNLGIFYEKYGAEFKRGGSLGTQSIKETIRQNMALVY